MTEEIVKKYTNGEITVVWKPSKCTHSTICWKELGKVFQPNERPWVKMENGTTEEIIKTVDNCPSAALTWQFNIENSQPKSSIEEPKTTVKMTPAGSIKISGIFKLIKEDGTEEIMDDIISICRCGISKAMPWCDGAHKQLDEYKKLHPEKQNPI